MQSIIISSVDAGQRLDKFLVKYMPLASKSFFYKMLRKKNITLNGKKAQGMEKISEGDEIKLFLADETIEKFRQKSNDVNVAIKSDIKLDIVYEDDNILVVNKPANLLSQKASKDDISLVEYIETYVMKKTDKDTGFKPGICNRLDRNTTGLIVAGKTIKALQLFNKLFKERDLEKYYLCLVKGKVNEKNHIMGYLKKSGSHNKVDIYNKETEGAVFIETAYEPLDVVRFMDENYTLLKVHLITGKSHQIRAHLKSIGHPIVGDSKYGEKKMYQIFKKEFGVRSQLLHGWKLKISEKEYIPPKYRGKEFCAPCPEIFMNVMQGTGIQFKE